MGFSQQRSVQRLGPNMVIRPNKNALDRTVMQVQQLAEEIGRSLTLPPAASILVLALAVAPMPLPMPMPRFSMVAIVVAV